MKTIKILLALLVLSSALLAQTGRDTIKLGNNPKAGHFAKIRGFNMYYEVYGKGEPLLIIHGNGGSMRDFVYQVPFFAKKYKVILADSRAQGRSVDDSDSLSFTMMADDLSALLDHLKIDSCNVIGWSDGGINALLLAMRHPKKVKKLASTGANLQPDTTAVYHWLVEMVTHTYDSVSKVPRTPEQNQQRKLLRIIKFEPHITPADLKKVQCPSLIIAGDHDLIKTAHTVLIAESIPKSNLWILPNSGHSTPIVYRDDFNRIILDFFSKPFRQIEGVARFR